MKKRTLEDYKKATHKSKIWMARIQRAETYKKNRK